MVTIVTWLPWIYYFDLKADFFLASSANGRPPNFITQKTGFKDDTAFQANNGSGNDINTDLLTPKKTPTTTRKADMLYEQIKYGKIRSMN